MTGILLGTPFMPKPLCPIHLAGKHQVDEPISDVLISNHFASAYQCGSHMCSNERVTIFYGLFFIVFFLIHSFVVVVLLSFAAWCANMR